MKNITISFRTAPLETIVMWIILLSYLSTGLYYRWKKVNKSMAAFVYGEQRISTIKIAASVASVLLSTEYIVLKSSEAFVMGVPAFSDLIGCIMGMLFGVYVFSPIFHKTRCTTVFEYLDKRFGKAVRRFAVIHFLLGLTLFCSTSLAVLANLLEIITYRSPFFVLVSTVFCGHFFYSLGGAKAVMCVNLFQQVLVLLATIVFVITASVDVGGITTILKRLREGGRAERVDVAVNFTKDGVWARVLSKTLFLSFFSGMSQMQHQFTSCCDTFKKRRRSLLFGNILYIIETAGFLFLGTAMYATLYVDDCATPTNMTQTELDMIVVFSRFMVNHCFPKLGMCGIVIPAISYCTLSNIASILSVLTFVSLRGLLDNLFPEENISEKRQLLMIKFLSNLYMGVIFFFTFSLRTVDILEPLVRVIQSGFLSTQSAMFTLGLLFRRTNQKCLFVAVIVGNVFILWAAVGSLTAKQTEQFPIAPCATSENSTNFQFARNRELSLRNNDTSRDETESFFPLYRLTKRWIAICSFVLMVTLGYVCSIFMGSKEEVDPELLIPITNLWKEKCATAKLCPQNRLPTKFSFRKRHLPDEGPSVHSKRKSITTSSKKVERKSFQKKLRKQRGGKAKLSRKEKERSRYKEEVIFEEKELASKLNSEGSLCSVSEKESEHSSRRENTNPSKVESSEKKL